MYTYIKSTRLVLLCNTEKLIKTGPAPSPSLVCLQLVKEGVVTILKHEVQSLATSEHLQQVHQVSVTQLLCEHTTQIIDGLKELKLYFKRFMSGNFLTCVMWMI